MTERSEFCIYLNASTSKISLSNTIMQTAPLLAPQWILVQSSPQSRHLQLLRRLSKLSRSVPNAKSHLVAHIQTPSPSPHRHLSEVPRPVQSHKSVPIISDWTQWAPSHCTPSHHQNSSRCGHP